jgi:hypothetical protein
MARAEDSDILDEARRSGRMVVTLDADFHTLMALSGATSPKRFLRIGRNRSTAGVLADIFSSSLARTPLRDVGIVDSRCRVPNERSCERLVGHRLRTSPVAEGRPHLFMVCVRRRRR